MGNQIKILTLQLPCAVKNSQYQLRFVNCSQRTLHSEFFEAVTLKVMITIGYDRPTITSADTVTSGSTLKLTCAGLKEGQDVIYNIVSGKEYAKIEGDILKTLKAGTVTVPAFRI